MRLKKPQLRIGNAHRAQASERPGCGPLHVLVQLGKDRLDRVIHAHSPLGRRAACSGPARRREGTPGLGAATMGACCDGLLSRR
jgi:hypothetical protein